MATPGPLSNILCNKELLQGQNAEYTARIPHWGLANVDMTDNLIALQT